MKAIVRFSRMYVVVLCQLGHVLTFSDMKNWGGSMLEAEIGDRKEGDRFERLAETCEGFGHE